MGYVGHLTTVISVGLGTIGTAAAARFASTPGFKLVGAVDPVKAGQMTSGGVRVSPSLAECRDIAAEVIAISTTSDLKKVIPLIVEGLESRRHVVSTCESLAYPWLQYPEEAGVIDAAARNAKRAVVACGVNPGFVMDVIPVLLGRSSLDVSALNVTRRVNLRRRRGQLRTKLGVGLDLQQWRSGARANLYGHSGLLESAHLCACGLGWELENVTFLRTPIEVDGRVAAVTELVEARSRNGGSLTLSLRFEDDGEDKDEITVLGSPDLRVVFSGGIHGDSATVAQMLSAAYSVKFMSAGLRLPIELPAATPNGAH